MDVVGRMLFALNDLTGQPLMAGPQQLGWRLVSAAAAALHADAVTLGVCVSPGGQWFCVGASDAQAAAADDQQVMLGQGPSMHVQGHGDGVHAEPATLTALWPQFAGWLATCSAFRSVTCVPLHALAAGAVLAVYHGPNGPDRPPRLGQIRAVGELMTWLLQAASNEGAPEELPEWMHTPQTVARRQVSVAVGMLAEHAGVAVADASALLRAHAFTEDRSVDDVAADLVSGHLWASALGPSSDQ